MTLASVARLGLMAELSCSGSSGVKRCLLKVDKEAYVGEICEVEHHLWMSDSQPTCRGRSALHFSSLSFGVLHFGWRVMGF